MESGRSTVAPQARGDDWLAIAEAAAYLRMTSAGVRSAMSRGELRPDGRGARRQAMFRVRTLDAFLEARLHA